MDDEADVCSVNPSDESTLDGYESHLRLSQQELAGPTAIPSRGRMITVTRQVMVETSEK